jgi:hypothetical protein
MKIHGVASITIAAILALAVTVPALAQNGEHVQFVANIEFIKGHLEQAVANKQTSNTPLAKAHSGHPIAEHYSLIQAEVEEHDKELNTELKGALTVLAGQVNTLGASEFQNQATIISGMLDDAGKLVISATEKNDAKFNAAVMASILKVAGNEYEEAVENGTIKALVEYQDAMGFISRAKATYDTSVKAAVQTHEDEEIVKFFELLDTRIAAKADSEEISTAIGGIIHELEEVFAIESTEIGKLDGWGYIDKINELLDNSLTEYKEGEFQQARTLAVKAYLENYENIESDIAEDDRELMEKIELNLREELTQMIDDRRPAAEIEAHIKMIKSDLETARTVVVPEFPLSSVVLASMAATILAGTYYTMKKRALPSNFFSLFLKSE